MLGKSYFGRTISKRSRVRQYQCGLAWAKPDDGRISSKCVEETKRCGVQLPVAAKRSHPCDRSRRDERHEEGIGAVGTFSFEIEFHVKICGRAPLQSNTKGGKLAADPLLLPPACLRCAGLPFRARAGARARAGGEGEKKGTGQISKRARQDRLQRRQAKKD
jgi:hypothetical protein